MKRLICTAVFLLSLGMANAQSQPNYDENKVPEFQVPDPLLTFNGEKIKTSTAWIQNRRPELLTFFETEVYGKVPDRLDSVDFKILDRNNNALGGKAIRKQIAITLTKNNKSLNYNLLIYLPVKQGKAPIFLGYNFHGNHTINTDPAIIIPTAWNMNSADLKIENHVATEESRGLRANRWALDKIIDSGFGLATIYYGEIDPDKNDFSDGLHTLFYKEGQTHPATEEWGSISAWAFGLSKAMDYLVQDDQVDQVIVFGHSRLGKASLWAGATDERFSGVISNDSGCGGAALSKRKFGETVGRINTAFPHWFSDSFKKYNENEELLPVDQHELLSLIAPRPLYVASAEDDQWADPRGEFLSAYYATPVYNLFGKEGIKNIKMPATNQPIQNTLAFHIRTGKHDVIDYDWEQYIAWAKTFTK